MIDLARVKSYVINLKKNIEKYNRALQNMSKISVRPQRFDAIYTKDVPKTEIDRLTYPSVQYTIDNGRYSDNNIGSLGGIGCFLSHAKLWEMLLNSQEEMFFILEDDAVPNFEISDKIGVFLNKVVEYDPEWDVIYFGWSKPSPGNLSDVLVGEEIYKINSITFQTHAYLISRKGAKKLLERAFPIVDQVDSYMSFMAMHRGLNAYRGDNYIVQNNPEGTDIQTEWSVKVTINRYHESTLKLILCIISISFFLLLLLSVYLYCRK